jgi:hypothetical protein
MITDGSSAGHVDLSTEPAATIFTWITPRSHPSSRGPYLAADGIGAHVKHVGQHQPACAASMAR